MIIKKKLIIKRNKWSKKTILKNKQKIKIGEKKFHHELKKYFFKIKFIAYILILLLLIFSIQNKKHHYFPKNIDLIAEKIYNSTGKLSFNELDKKYKKIKIDYSKYNNINIGMSFNNDYYLLTTVTIASILKNLSNKTYAHIHIIETGDFIQETRKKLQSLKYKINNNSEFIFYNGSKAIDDFGYEIKNNSPYGVGEYARLMAPDLINTDRIIIIDSGDVIVKKDLVEFYNMDLQDKLVWGIIDPFARCFNDFIMHNKENYINGGVLLFNSKKWREMEIYKDIINFYKAFKFNGRLGLPIQQILNTFLPYLSIGILPLKYNFQYHPYISADCVAVNKEQVKDAQENEVIRHNNKMKPHTRDGDVSTWFYYANLTGFIDELCQKFPSGCRHKS